MTKNNNKGPLLVMLTIVVTSLVVIISSFGEKYKNYEKINTTFTQMSSRYSDGTLVIILKTESGTFVINNILANEKLYDSLKYELLPGDSVVIYYYKKNDIIGIEKNDKIVLDLENSIVKLEKNSYANRTIFSLILIASIGYYIYEKLTKKNKDIHTV